MSAPLLTSEQLAARLNVKRDTVTRNAGRIPGARKVFGRWRFDAEQVEAWLAAKAEQADPWAKPQRGVVA